MMDNVIFSSDTVWSKHASKDYKYYNNKVGKVFINDAVDISGISSNSYDFVFASHSLEHIANPIRALKEWLRVVRDDGYIIGESINPFEVVFHKWYWHNPDDSMVSFDIVDNYVKSKLQ
jgi:ubiquinone/menaquinone biosynthesis C-methylase UbiE